MAVDVEELKQRWMQALEAPEVRTFLMAVGAGLMQPVRPGENALANALQTGTRAVENLRQAQQQALETAMRQRQQALTAEMQQRQLGLQEEQLRQQGELAKARLAQERQRTELERARLAQEAALRERELATRRELGQLSAQTQREVAQLSAASREKVARLQAQADLELAKLQQRQPGDPVAAAAVEMAKTALREYTTFHPDASPEAVASFAGQIYRRFYEQLSNSAAPEAPSAPQPAAEPSGAPPAAAPPETLNEPTDIPRPGVPSILWKALSPDKQRQLANIAASEPPEVVRRTAVEMFLRSFPASVVADMLKDEELLARLQSTIGDNELFQLLLTRMKEIADAAGSRAPEGASR